MNQATAKKRYLVISRGQWDEGAKKEDVQRAIDRFYDRPLEQAKDLATDTTNETPDAWRVR